MSDDTPSPLNNVITIDHENQAPPRPCCAGQRGGDLERMMRVHSSCARAMRRFLVALGPRAGLVTLREAFVRRCDAAIVRAKGSRMSNGTSSSLNSEPDF
jgi:hypothetical protein